MIALRGLSRDPPVIGMRIPKFPYAPSVRSGNNTSVLSESRNTMGFALIGWLE